MSEKTAKATGLSREQLAELDPENKYIFGVTFDDRELIQEAWGNGVDPDARIFGHGANALIFAVSISEDLTRFLLEHGVTPHYFDRDGASPLGNAISGRNVAIVRLLLVYGADPTLKFPGYGSHLEPRTILDIAAAVGDEEILRLWHE